MFKVRIKTSPGETNPKSTGQQEDYGLVRNLRGMQNSPEQYAVNDTMGAIPRSEANIEVEGGESVIGDINNDGTMELMHFTGKRHTQGGVPVNIPEGSFIYSDTKNLTIKDPEVIEKIFNLPFRKQGYTPAEISKKYDINIYVEILKDETSDPLSKRSAAEMLKKNKQKLGLLAFIQESMKGFPDGIPAIAEEVLSSMGIDPNQMAQQFAPQQPQQGQMPQGQPQGQMMPPPQEGQGIPMSEDAMQGMMPEGPAVAPEDLANQMSGKFGGVMLPSYEQAGAVSGCPKGQKMYMGKCVDEWRIPKFEDEQVWSSRPVVSVPKKKPTVSDVKAQKLFDEKFRVLTAAEQLAAKKAKIKAEQARTAFDPAALLASANANRTANTSLLSEEDQAYEYFLGKSPEPKIEPIPGSMQLQGTFRSGVDSKGNKVMIGDGALWDPENTSGLTPEEIARRAAEKTRISKDQRENPYKYNIPGFGSASDLKEYMSQNYQQQVAGDTFYKALLTNDPQQMLKAAEEIKSIDVPWSIGWMPFTDQDKIDDMYTILHEEALKKINEKQKDIIVKDYGVTTIKTKLNDVIKKYEKLRDDATDIKTKLTYAAKLDKYNKYKERLITNGEYNSFINEVKKSNVKSNSSSWFGFLDYDLGDPIQDQYMGQRGAGDETTMMSVLEEITKEHDVINKTNVAIDSPLAFKGQTSAGGSLSSDSGSFSSEPSASFEMFNTEGGVRDVYNKLYGEKSSPKDAKGYAKEYKLNAEPTSTFRMGKNDENQVVWFQETENGSEFEVSNPEWVKTLNAAATIKEGKTVMLLPAKGPVDIIDMLEEENKVNPPIIPEKKSKVVTPAGTNTQGKPKPKYEVEGITDKTFDDAFKNMKFGGTMQSVGSNVTIGDKIFRYGGLINENGKLRYDRGGSVLPKYDDGGPKGPAGPDKSAVVVQTINGKPTNTYTMTYHHSDGKKEHDTVIYVFEDPTDNKVIARRNKVTNESIPNDAEITRSSYEYITKDNLNDYEKKVLAEKWNGAAGQDQYLTYLNTAQEMRRNPDFRKELYAQYQKDVALENNYTGRATGRSTYKPLLPMDETEMMNQLLKFEERNARLSSFGLVDGEQKVENKSGSGQDRYINKTANDLIKANIGALGDLKFDEGYKGQAAYIAYNNLVTSPKYTAQNFAAPQYGVSDEDIGRGKGRVSGIDNWNTNTTLKQRLGWNTTPPPPEEKPGEKNAFFCVEYSDGTKEIKTVSYKEGEPVVEPKGDINGKTVTKATQYQTSDEATKNCIPDPKIPPGTPPKGQSQTWFAPDIVNYAAATRQIIPNTPPTLRQMAQPISGYDTINPITRIAGTTGLMRQQQDLAMNTMDATTGFAAMAGQGYDQLSKDIAGVEEYNATNIVNPYLTRVGNLATDVDYKNTILRGKFDQEGAVYQEELAAQRNKKGAQEAMLWGQGYGNVLKDNSLRLAYPNAFHAQRLTPTLAWSGVGRDPLGANTNVSPGGASVAQEDCSAVYTQALEQAKSNSSMDDAAKKAYADTAMKGCMARNNSIATQQNKTQQQQYATGLGNMFGGARFGGAMYTAPGAMEFGGMYYDDNY